MNLGKSVKTLSSKFNLALRISKPVCGKNVVDVKKIHPAAFTDYSKNEYKKSNSMLQQHELGLLNFYHSQGERMTGIISKTDLPVTKEIVEPEKLIKLEIPLRNLTNKEVDLPCDREKDMVEPTDHIVSKKALNMIKIRARKMRLHKRKKFIRRNKTLLAKKKDAKALKKEFEFQSGLKEMIKEAESFDALKMVEEKLKMVHWERPITRAKGRLAPDWVIKEVLEKEKEKKMYKERVEECIKKTL